MIWYLSGSGETQRQTVSEVHNLLTNGHQVQIYTGKSHREGVSRKHRHGEGNTGAMYNNPPLPLRLGSYTLAKAHQNGGPQAGKLGLAQGEESR